MASLDQFQRAQRVLFLDHVILDLTATWNFTLFKRLNESGFSRQHVCCLVLILDLWQNFVHVAINSSYSEKRKEKTILRNVSKICPIKSSSYPASAP